MKQKFYVVWKGRETGVFKTWEECKAQVDKFPGAQYKSFDSRRQAEQAYRGTYLDYVTLRFEHSDPLIDGRLWSNAKPIAESYAVDSAWSYNRRLLEYRCVHTTTGEEIFRQGPYRDGSNNIGEFLALVHALALFQRERITAPIYSDSRIAIGWVKWGKCRTNVIQTERNAELFRLIERAEKWLHENSYENLVLKWRTHLWGEIPADFGRKWV